MLKEVFTLSAAAILATSCAKEVVNVKRSDFINGLCNSEYTCSEIQIDFAQKLHKILKSVGLKIPIYNNGDFLVYPTDVYGNYVFVGKDGEVLQCTTEGRCSTERVTPDQLLQYYREHYKNQAKKQSNTI